MSALRDFRLGVGESGTSRSSWREEGGRVKRRGRDILVVAWMEVVCWNWWVLDGMDMYDEITS